MIEKLSKKIAFLIYNNLDEKNPQQLEIMEYSFHVFLAGIIKTTLLLLIAYFLGVLKLFLITLVSTGVYKIFAGGVHADSHLSCFLMSFGVFFGIILLGSYIPINSFTASMILIFNVIVIFYYAPADVKNKPIRNLIIRRNLKIVSLITMVLTWSYAMLFINDSQIKGIIIYSLLATSILMTPMLYRVLKAEYGFKEI
jgi:accessory gene regulator B